MDISLVIATTTITLALVFYTLGVFKERNSGTLTKASLVFFWAGFVFDTTGTTIMSLMAKADGGTLFSVHGISGLLAILLMIGHALWATVTYVRKNERSMKNFHTFSSLVWLFWLIPYTVGILQGVPMLSLGAVPATLIALAISAVLAVIVLRPKNKNLHS